MWIEKELKRVVIREIRRNQMKLQKRVLCLLALLSLSFLMIGCWLNDDDDDDQIGPSTGAIKLSAVADAGAGNAFAASMKDAEAGIRAAVANKFVARIKIGAARARIFNLDRSDNGQTLTLDATVDAVGIGKQQLTIEIVPSGVANPDPILKTIATATVVAGQTNDGDIKNAPINYETTVKAIAYEAWPASSSKTIDDFAPSSASIAALAATIQGTLGSSIDGTKTLNDATIKEEAEKVAEAVTNPPPAAVTLFSIAINPTSGSVVTNSTFNLANVVVTATYSDASTKAVTGHTWSVKSGNGSISGSTYTPPTTSGNAILTCTFTENGTTVTADLNLTVNAPPRFSKDANNVITDSQTGLQWFCTTAPFSWYQARDWAAALTWNGGGWRLPTLAELGPLHPAAEGSGLFTVRYSWTNAKKIQDDPETATTDESEAYFYNYYEGWEASYSCAADGGTTNNTIAVRSPLAGSVTGISLNKTSATVAVGGSETLTATILPNDATNQAVTWSSSKESVATVDSTGKVTGVAAGKTLIIAKTADGGLTAECVVTVTVQMMPIEMVNIPAGTFLVYDATKSFFVSAFKMSKFETTREQFYAIMGFDPSDTSVSNGNTDPVQMVNWYHAIAFCNRLSIAEGLEPVYGLNDVDFSKLAYAEIPTSFNSTWNSVTCDWSKNGYRLPTHVELVWAAIGADAENLGTVNVNGYRKAFAGSTGSNLLSDYAWYSENSNGKTHPVGTKLPNELGLYDLSGNVYEWCWDWFDMFPTGSFSDYRGPENTGSRLCAGGCWSETSVLISHYGGNSPERQHNAIGFRVVRP